MPSQVFEPVIDKENQLRFVSEPVAVIVLLCAGEVFGLVIMIVGNVLSKVTSEKSVVPDTTSHEFPKRSLKFMVNGIGPSVSVQLVIYMPLHKVPAPMAGTPVPKIVIKTQVKFSLPVNESVMILPDNARTHEALFD